MKQIFHASLLCVAIVATPAFGISQDIVGGEATATGPALSPDFINFGYLQNNTVLPFLQYEALTHIAAPFVNFDTNGNLENPQTFSNRSSYLKSGGAAQRAGTKVIACIRNSGFSEAILDSVMQDPVKRTRLKNQVVSLVTADNYCAGVNFDFELVWGTATRDGITAFVQEVRAALPAQYELSVYTQPIYYSTRWNIPAIVDDIDYLLFSTYDWGTGPTPHANADFDNAIRQASRYIDAGVPPEKLVLTWATYGRRWFNTTGYDVISASPSGKQSQGFYNGLYDTTLRQRDNGPFTANYVRGDEIGWHSYTENGRNYTSVWETPESLEYKIAAALSFPGDEGNNKGLRLGGVGWWSLMWVSNYFHPLTGGGNFFDSYDPVGNTIVGRPPYYRHVDLLVQEILKRPGQTQFVLESFENQNPHWRDPNESPDTSGDTDFNSSYSNITSPAGINRPPGTTRAGRLYFDFEAASGNRAFLRYEILNDAVETNITDTNAALALVSANTRFSGHYYAAGNYSARTLRLAVMDGLRQIEVSNPITLPSVAGWNSFQWDINDPAQVNAWNSAEPALEDGNGIVNTSGAGARDVSFLGFIIEGGGAGTGHLYFDELKYEDHAPAGKNYVINEFRYSDPSKEFVEIAGPPGPFPTDIRLVMYDPGSGNQLPNPVSLAGKSIPASGLFVIGDAGVPGASGTTGFVPAGWGSSSNIPATAPGALQLYGTSSGHVYDSVVYAAFGGVGELSRAQSRRVTGEGYGWLGNVGTGLSGNGEPYTIGRMPDGADTDFNQQDFSNMPPSPGQSNGAGGLINTLLSFSTAPGSAFQTYQAMKFVPPAIGMPASPGGGNVYRCVDTNGGGVTGIFGDALMGEERGVDVTGKLYIPATGHQAQAVAVGLGGTQGSAFFSSTPGSSGYENGYWLTYENGTVNLADGQNNHPSQFQFVMASNDNQDSVISAALGANKSLAQVSAGAGTWVDFHLRLDPTAAAGEQLLAQVNGVDIYRGPIPAGGRASGAFTVGHRETGGGVVATEGTWVDDILITYANPPARVEEFELY